MEKQPKIIIEEKYEHEVETIRHNLNLMNSEMMSVVNSESIGVNAGNIEIENKRIPCATANGYLDKKTGKIVKFGNIGEIAKKWEWEKDKNYYNFSFLIAIDWSSAKIKAIASLPPEEQKNFKQRMKIIEITIEDKQKNIDHVRRIINESTKEWNEEHWGKQ